MNKKLDFALIVLRLTGLILAYKFGLPKVIGLLEGDQTFIGRVDGLGFPFPIFFAWCAALTELVGGNLVAFGIATRTSASLCAFVMVVAAFVRHHALGQLMLVFGWIDRPADTVRSWGDPTLALLFLSIFITLALTGPGRVRITFKR